MSDWRVTGMFDRTFWTEVGTDKLHSDTASDALKTACTAARDPDLTWRSKTTVLDAICANELAWSIARHDGRIRWTLQPFHDVPEAEGTAHSISGAIDALSRAASAKLGIDLVR